MNQHVEIEFAVNLQPKDNDPLIFNFLQIRPIVEYTDLQETTIETTKQEDTIILSNAALGNGVIKSICDIVYIKPEVFNAADSPRIANEVEHLNRKFIEQGKNYVLVGPGRWGSSDSWLGIPVKWSQISAARVIVESGLPHYRIDPSQGTHFFQNLTSFRVGYFTINPYANDGWYDVDYLNNLPAVFEDKYLRHISFEKPLTIKIDGKRNKGVIYKNF